MAVRSPSPGYAALPLLAWLSVLICGLLGLVLGASAWTTAAWPGGANLLAGGPSGSAELALAFVLPALLVLGIGFVVARGRGLRAPAGASWEPAAGPSGGSSP